jgi:predicted O-methyltransferase YrrM
MPSQTQKTDVEQLIEDRPQFHAQADGTSVSWAVCPDVLRFIYESVAAGSTTLETGSGHTTVAFAMAGANHVAVTPSEDESKKITEYCTKLGIASTVRFVIEPSDTALPQSEIIPEELDFALIDGAHAFPLPFVDFHYTERRLKVGGIMGVDDIFMPSVRILYDFLQAEDDWELVRQIEDTAFFRRLGRNESTGDTWASQKINKAFWDRKVRRQRSRLRWLIYLPVRMVRNPKRYFGRWG